MPTYKNNTNHPQYYGNKLKFVAPGESIETISIVIHENLTKTSDEPYYVLAKGYEDITFSAAESQTASDLLNGKVLRVSTDVNITIKANASGNPYPYPLDAGDTIDLDNSGGTIDSLVLTSGGAGSARVIKLEV